MRYITGLILSVGSALAGALFIETELNLHPRNLEQEVLDEIKSLEYKKRNLEYEKQRAEREREEEKRIYNVVSELRQSMDRETEELRRASMQDVLTEHGQNLFFKSLERVKSSRGPTYGALIRSKRGSRDLIDTSLDYLTFGCTREEKEKEELIQSVPWEGLARNLIKLSEAGKEARKASKPGPKTISEVSDFFSNVGSNYCGSQSERPTTLDDVKKDFDVYLSGN